jgi:hypothetical protein
MDTTTRTAIFDQVVRVAVEERLRDELAIRNWWATTGESLGWTRTSRKRPGALQPMLPMQAEHRARLRLLVGILRSARKATR